MNENVNRLCTIDSLPNLTPLQRVFLPIFPCVNNSNEFYPLLANRPCKL